MFGSWKQRFIHKQSRENGPDQGWIRPGLLSSSQEYLCTQEKTFDELFVPAWEKTSSLQRDLTPPTFIPFSSRCPPTPPPRGSSRGRVVKGSLVSVSITESSMLKSANDSDVDSSNSLFSDLGSPKVPLRRSRSREPSAKLSLVTTGYSNKFGSTSSIISVLGSPMAPFRRNRSYSRDREKAKVPNSGSSNSLANIGNFSSPKSVRKLKSLKKDETNKSVTNLSGSTSSLFPCNLNKKPRR